MEHKNRIGVIGGGSWATAIVKILLDNSKEKSISWWMRNQEAITHIRTYHRNPHYLSAVELSPDLYISDDLEAIVERSDILILNVPAAFLHQVLSGLPQAAFQGKIWVSAIKGIVPETHQIVAEYLHETFTVALNQMVVISGPCHAEEVSQARLSYLTLASIDSNVAETLSAFISTPYIMTTITEDIYGTEYSAVLKNIYAVASGICHGVGFGDNFQAVLIANAIQEIERFVAAVHPIDRDIKESAYLGDLLVTAYSQYSRNRTFGNMIGKGYSTRSAQLEMNMVAEGYYASKSIFEINRRYQVHMPICDTVYGILYADKNPLREMKILAEQLS